MKHEPKTICVGTGDNAMCAVYWGNRQTTYGGRFYVERLYKQIMDKNIMKLSDGWTVRPYGDYWKIYSPDGEAVRTPAYVHKQDAIDAFDKERRLYEREVSLEERFHSEDCARQAAGIRQEGDDDEHVK